MVCGEGGPDSEDVDESGVFDALVELRVGFFHFGCERGANLDQTLENGGIGG